MNRSRFPNGSVSSISSEGAWAGTGLETIAALDVVRTFARVQVGQGAATYGGEVEVSRLL